MNILISACLLGMPCRYDGNDNYNEKILALGEYHNLIPVCPEQMGGLPTPRTPAERVGQFVLTRDGEDVTDEYRRGAEFALKMARDNDCSAAVLKERSPSCGSGKIYDGSFSGTLTDGWGVTAELLLQNGISVYGESEIDRLFPRF